MTLKSFYDRTWSARITLHIGCFVWNVWSWRRWSRRSFSNQRLFNQSHRSLWNSLTHHRLSCTFSNWVNDFVISLVLILLIITGVKCLFISRFIFQYRIRRKFSSHVPLLNEVFTIVSVYHIPLSLLFLGWFCGDTSHWEQQGQNFQSKDFYRTVMATLSRHMGKQRKNCLQSNFLSQNTQLLKTIPPWHHGPIFIE